MENPQRPVDTVATESEESKGTDTLRDVKYQGHMIFHVLDENGYFEGAD